MLNAQTESNNTTPLEDLNHEDASDTLEDLHPATVKWFNNEKGYGFINSESFPGVDIFVHYSAIEGEGYKTLREGQIVGADIGSSPRGLSASLVVMH